MTDARTLSPTAITLPKGDPRRIKAEHVLEKHVEHAGDQLMASLGFTAVRLSQSRASAQTPGIPDRKYYHLSRGYTLWWECKRPGGKQSFKQRVFQEMAQSCGEVYALGGLDDLKAAVAKMVRDRGDTWRAALSLTPLNAQEGAP